VINLATKEEKEEIETLLYEIRVLAVRASSLASRTKAFKENKIPDIESIALEIIKELELR